jgi:8-oxo-dGTP pyrophosphatase MutT (NUDIX family)
MDKHLTASGLIINEEGKVLLLKHKKLGVWLYPGGHVEKEETPDQALVREVKEETGLEIEIISNKDEDLADELNDVDVLHHPYAILCERIGNDDQHYHIDLVYRCKIIENKAEQVNLQEAEEMNFFGKEDLAELEMFPNLKRLLRKIL